MANLHNIYSYIYPSMAKDDNFKLFCVSNSVKTRFNTLMNVINSRECQGLCLNNLEIYVKILLTEDSDLLQYMLRESNIESFVNTYHQTYIENVVFFQNIPCPYKRFALAWLYHEYH